MKAISKGKIIVLFLFTINGGYAQFTDTLAQIAKVVFYEKKIHNKIFTEHKDYVDEQSVLLLFNPPLSRKYPDLSDKLNTYKKIGEQTYSTLFLNEKSGVVILTLPRYDSGRTLLVGFHKFFYTSTEAYIEFRTTSKFLVNKLTDRYVKVTCSLRNKNGEWEIKNLKIEKNDCCKDYPYYAWDIIDERYFK